MTPDERATWTATAPPPIGSDGDWWLADTTVTSVLHGDLVIDLEVRAFSQAGVSVTRINLLKRLDGRPITARDLAALDLDAVAFDAVVTAAEGVLVWISTDEDFERDRQRHEADGWTSVDRVDWMRRHVQWMANPKAWRKTQGQWAAPRDRWAWRLQALGWVGERRGRITWSPARDEALMASWRHVHEHQCGHLADMADHLGLSVDATRTRLSLLRKEHGTDRVPRGRPGRPRSTTDTNSDTEH